MSSQPGLHGSFGQQNGRNIQNNSESSNRTIQISEIEWAIKRVVIICFNYACFIISVLITVKVLKEATLPLSVFLGFSFTNIVILPLERFQSYKASKGFLSEKKKFIARFLNDLFERVFIFSSFLIVFLKYLCSIGLYTLVIIPICLILLGNIASMVYIQSKERKAECKMLSFLVLFSIHFH